MQRPVTVLMDFAKDSPLEIVSFARNTMRGMTDNKDFPNPDVSLQEITSRADTLEAKENLVRSGTGGIDATIERDAAKKLLISALKANGRYVGHLAYGNAEKISSSGYRPSTGASQPAQKGGAPVVDVTPSKTPGAASIDIASEGKVRAFTAVVVPVGTTVLLAGDVLRILPGSAAGGDALVITDTDRSINVTGLTSGTRYNVYGYTVNTAGASDLSAMVSFVAQ